MRNHRRILLLGSGGREHAIALSLSKSPNIAQLYIAPGNAGTRNLGINVDMNICNFVDVKNFVLLGGITIVVVGPEEPLVRGIYDFFKNDKDLQHVTVIGPSMEGAKLEGSKSYAKEFMKRHAIPTAAYHTFTISNIEEGYTFIDTLKAPYVLKANGLAAGKGVVILNDAEEAKYELKSMLSGKFGHAGDEVVIEEFLSGIEMSAFVFTDGVSYKMLPEAKDYKRIGEGDTGLNTGGMGAVSPVPFADAAFMEKVRMRIVEPTVAGLCKDNIEYCGFIFIGLMNVGGDPYVIEYNVRMGDPETEVVFPRIESDVVDLFDTVTTKTLSDYELVVSSDYATTVVCTSCGYPNEYPKGLEIVGLDNKKFESIVFHAGTKYISGRYFTNGGRVLAVTSLAPTMIGAVRKSYNTINKICYDGMYYRRDISLDL